MTWWSDLVSSPSPSPGYVFSKKSYSDLHCQLHNVFVKSCLYLYVPLWRLSHVRPQGLDLQNKSCSTTMAPQVSNEMCAQIIIWHNEKHLCIQEIADLAGCSVRTVYSILSYHCDYGTLRNLSTRGPHGGERSLNMGDMNYISSLIDTQPKIYLDEIQEELLNWRDVLVSIATLFCALRRIAITNKQVANAALERNELLHATWQAAYTDIPAEYCIWLDEASVDNLTNQWTAGWAVMGRPCICRAKGFVNKECFFQFLNEQLVKHFQFTRRWLIFSIGSKIEPISRSPKCCYLRQLCHSS